MKIFVFLLFVAIESSESKSMSYRFSSRFFLLFCSLSVKIRSDEDCFANGIRKINDQFAVRIHFSPKTDFKLERCLIDIENGWSNELKNGFGSFLLQPMDCSTTVTIDCLSNRDNSSIQYTCHTSFNNHEINCNSIRLTFQRNPTIEEKKVLVQLQLTALAKQPCFDKDIFYQCQESYPNSCIDKSLHCNGRSECPRGDDERACHRKKLPKTIDERFFSHFSRIDGRWNTTDRHYSSHHCLSLSNLYCFDE